MSEFFGGTKRKLTAKQLESYLQDLDDFSNPKASLEQYATPPHIAANVLSTIDLTYNDLEGKSVADLGCGTGRLSIGSIMCGAEMVVGFDIDGGALKCALKNVIDIFGDEEDECDLADDFGTTPYQACEKLNFIRIDLAETQMVRARMPFRKVFDTVVMNPPFGTKNNEGIDMIFLKRAIDMCSGSVYSLHKTSTREHIRRQCQEWDIGAKPVTQIKYNLDSSYKFHKKKSVDIDVDLWRITC